ncbi:DUF4012 domain-containing protein [Plantactinospora sp. GCM10030261]|uniref:DUF4012 domain-containing protein n=1 Tax=Plantactinospora sp. GCM10030261 TaxID=3273420 RepID=UPI00360C1F49
MRIRRILLSTLVVGSLLALTAGWVGVRGWQTRGHLTSAAGLARDLSTQIVAGDVAQARRTLDALQRQTAAARTTSGDPTWALAGRLPFGGANLAAVHEVATTLDELARRTFPDLLRVDVAALTPRDGRVDLATISAAARDITAADTSAQAIRASFARSPDGLAGPVREAVVQVHDTLDRLVRLTFAARQAAMLLPPLLGAKGERNYLFAFQNPAEVRATGGMFGAYAVVRVADGRARIVKQGAGTGLGVFANPLPVEVELRRLFGDLAGIYPADVNLSPHFPTAATLYREMYRRHTGQTVDGVLATDPVALAHLLRVTGPVELTGGTALTSATAVKALLSDVYRQPSEKQDGYFARATKAVFDALLTRPLDMRAVVTALGQSVAERRLLFWSAHPEEQKTIAGTAIAGILPDQETTPRVGVFLNDGTGAKLSYYLRPEATLSVADCRPDGRRELRLRVTLGSTAPRSGLSPSVLGFESRKASKRYTVRTLVSVYSPAGGAVLRARMDGEPIGVGAGRERRRHIGVATVDLAPGQTRVLEVDLLTPVTDSGAAELQVTPLATPWTTRISSAPSCSE